MSSKTVESLEEYKFNLLNLCLELNEYKTKNKFIPVETYEQMLDQLLTLVDTFIDSENWNNEFKSSIGNVLGVQF